MINQFSPKVSEVLSFSREEAERLASTSVGPEHILLGILREKDGPVQDLFTRLHLNTDNIKQQLEERITENNAGKMLLNTEMLLNDQANNILRLAVLEARLQRSQTVEVPHLLLAILHDNVDNGAKLVLENNDLNYELAASAFQKKTNNTVDSVGMPDEEEDDDPMMESQRNQNSQGHQGGSATATARQHDGKSKTPILDNFSTDLTNAAADGKLDPVVGREREIQRVCEILGRRKKNNPILIGEPGIRGLIQELEKNPDIIIFIDEIHTIIGAGSTPGSMDAANILKPALARGTIQCIGATTLDEYRNSIEKDGALERRFQKVLVEPTTADETLQILQNIKGRYEDHHHVRYTDDALMACVQLTDRYITDRYFPDKAIDALDEVGSRVHLQHDEVPQEIIDTEKEIENVKAKKVSAVSAQNFEMAASYRG